MKWTGLLVPGICALALTAGFAMNSLAGEEKPDAAGASKPVKKYLGDPHKRSATHERLKEMLGKWDVTMKVVPKIDAEPMVLTSVATRTLINDGLLVREECTWDIPGFGGPRRFMFLYGYNSGTGDFEKMEIGEDTTQINLLTGPWDGKSNEIEIRSHHGTMQWGGTMLFESRTVIHLDDLESKDAEGKVTGITRRERHITHDKIGDEPEYPRWEFTYTPRGIPAPDMAKVKAHMTPGPGQKWLEGMIGTFTATMEMKAAASPDVMKGTGSVTRSWKVPGLILEETAVWKTPMGELTMHAILSHHNGTGEFEMIYFHAMNSNTDRMTGKTGKDGTLTLSGEVWDPYMGETVTKTVQVTPEKDGKSTGHMTLKYGTTEFYTGTLEYVRAKDGEPSK